MRRHLGSLAAGVTAGMDNLGAGVAFAALLFPGALAAGLGMGVGVMLLSAALLSIVIAWRSSHAGTVALVQETGIAVLVASMAGLLAGLEGRPVEDRIATVFAILGASTVVTGALFVLFGRLRLGTLVRFLPYPVVAGFLAGSGWLLIEGALIMVAGEHQLSAMAAALDRPLVLGALAPAVLVAVVMAVSLHRSSHPLTMSTVLLGSGAAFYLVLAAAGIAVEDARLWHWLPDVPAEAAVALPSPLWIAAHADWGTVLQAAPAMAAVAVLNIIGLLLSTSGLEAASGREIDANAELRASGLANLLVGGLGGPAGYTGLGMTLLAAKMGATGRGAGMAAGLILLVGLGFAGVLASAMPTFLAAGLMVFLGGELLYQWAMATRRQLPRAEWLIVLAILAAIAALGFLSGLVLGLAFSVVMFVYNYARLPVVRLVADGRQLRSGVDRSPDAVHALDRQGEQVHVLRLQGYLFFGTMEQVVARVRERIAQPDAPPLRFLILDLAAVSGMDSAATSGFLKIRGMVAHAGAPLVFCALPPGMAEALARSGLTVDADATAVSAADLDHALERCEEELLATENLLSGSDDVTHHLEAILGPHPRLVDLAAAMRRLRLSAGTTLIRSGDPADDVFLVSNGRVRVQVTLADGRVLRLRTMTAGAVVGEVGLCLTGTRTADVVVEGAATVFRLYRSDLERLEQEDGELAVLFHRLLTVTLAEKLVLANRLVQLAHG
ncbi:SLC26A/SulP transporter family protein [Caenispirillum bisanense]|uniref:Sulfate permease, SulP family n=1 Tax=Caenispirillum bisanense TaxID=414052 RepID=A0A286GDE2_9PROT|nr:SulP family inorganic anion transporter [Caenispirillum bisanense]SOD93522.1 sulfate permease, SulP family [Caenispirillum bisanense]